MTLYCKAAATALILLLSSFASEQSHAQTSSTTAAPNMWGTVPSGVSVPGALDSAIMHAQNGVVAGQVNAARAGALYGSNATIQSIGSQTIMQTSIIGNNNSSSTNGTQTSTNSGATTNTGTVR